MARSTHYRSSQEQLEECLELIYMRLSAAYLQALGDEETREFRGISLRGEDVERILSPQERLSAQEISDLRQAEAGFRRKSVVGEQLGVRLPLEEIIRAFRLTPLQRFLLLLAVAMEVNQELERVVAYLQEDMTARAPTLGFGLRLFALTNDVAPMEVFGQEEFLGSLFLPADPMAKPIARPLRLHPRVMEYLADPDASPASLRGVATLYDPKDEPPELRFVADVVDDLAVMEELAPSGKGRALLLQGDAGSGKRLALRHLAKRKEQALLVAEMDALPVEDDVLTLRMGDLMRECRLKNAMLALRLKDARSDDALPRCRRVLAALQKGQAIWLLSDTPFPQAAQLADDQWDWALKAMPRLTATQRGHFWQEQLGQEAQSVDVDLLANKYDFTPGMMIRACQDMRTIARWHDMQGLSLDRVLAVACRQQMAHNMGGNATLVESPFQWDDLVLPQEKKAQLYSICAQVRNQHLVFDTWGFARQIPYGQGLSALFTGQPGTGKTMAAQVLANQLGLELYQVNLAAVVSKYIGETEKNLEAVFTEGQRGRCILFFDEADALFAKRTELKDSNDRFANAESAYLLQRIENYPGMVILATNYAQNFDPAFRRRIKHTIEFPIPDEASRLLLWQKVLAPPAPVDPALDVSDLAARHELTGSAIKNVAMNAAFLAAEQRQSIGKEHVQQALRTEYAKSGRVVDVS